MDFPVTILAIERAVRLVATGRLRDSVLLRLVGSPLLDDLAEIEGATSGRLQEESVGTTVFRNGRPHSRFVNAAFAYFRPRALNRFNNSERGAWYAALELDTAITEVAFHISRELSCVNDFNTSVEYSEMWASFAGEFVDLRGIAPAPDCLHPEPTIGYPAGNLLAEKAMSEGRNGIVYPSVRHGDGTCLVALWPHVVQSVAQGKVIRLIWSGQPTHTVEVACG